MTTLCLISAHHFQLHFAEYCCEVKHLNKELFTYFCVIFSLTAFA